MQESELGRGFTRANHTITNHWHVVRLRPGAQRQDRRDPRFMSAELDLLRNGFDFYCPVEVFDCVHPRTKKVIQRYRPLLPGYCFVSGVTNFWALSECKTVAGVLGVSGTPLAVSERDVAAMRAEETAIFATLAGDRVKRRKAGQKKTRRGLQRQYPNGACITILDGFLASERGRIESVSREGRVRVMLDRFANMGVIELEAASVEAA